MISTIRGVCWALSALCVALPVRAQQPPGPAVVWEDRGDPSALDIAGRFDEGPRRPGTRFTYVKETHGGTSPKLHVTDERGVAWKVKLGEEVQSETAAARLLWAAGYFVDEDYYRTGVRVLGLPRLTRGQQFVQGGDTLTRARFERDRGGPDPRHWQWRDNPLLGTRELNGLRVMMALVNNWDLKDVNNAVYEDAGRRIYVVSDLGATLGRTGNSFIRSKAVIDHFAGSPFIRGTEADHVDFVLHSRPFPLTWLYNPRYSLMRTRIERIVRGVPIADVRWIGARLGRLSPRQIGDCFRAAGFAPPEVDRYTQVVLQRIAALNRL